MMELNKEIFLRGNSISLRVLLEEDVSGSYSRWLNDSEVTHHNSHGRFPITEQKLLEYVKTALNSNNMLALAVIDNKEHNHIGNISLQNINWIDRNAEIAFLLGEKSFWGKGIMLEAGTILIDHGFNSLNLHRIYCGTSLENTGMQKLAEKLGFKKEGHRKEAIFNKGKYIDVIEYGILSKI